MGEIYFSNSIIMEYKNNMAFGSDKTCQCHHKCVIVYLNIKSYYLRFLIDLMIFH